MKINIKKKNWQLIKLGEVLKKTEDNDKENAKNRYQKFLKVEHLDAECLHVKRWGEHDKEELPPTFFKIFKKGQILFPTRNPHLKRAAFVHFDGICGEKTLTLEPMDLLVDHTFIPFLFHSKKFYDHSTSAIIGSTNPHVRWRDIAEFEFLLPPKEEQTKLAQLLWAADNVVEKDKALLERLENCYLSNRESVMFPNSDSNHKHNHLKINVSKNIEFKELKEYLVDIRYGTSQKNNSDNQGYKVLGVPNVVSERIKYDDVSYVVLTDKEFQSTRLSNGDILIVRTNGNPEYTGRCALFKEANEPFVFASYLIKISIDEGIYNPEFIVRYLQTNTIRKYFRRSATSTAGNYNINTETIKSVPVPIVKKKEQLEILKKLIVMEENFTKLNSKLQSSQALLKSLINEVFQ